MIFYPIALIILAYVCIEQRQTIIRLRNTNARLTREYEHYKIKNPRDNLAQELEQARRIALGITEVHK